MKLKKKTEKAILSVSDFRKPEIKVIENNSVAEVSEKEMPKEVLSTTNLDFENLWRKASDIDDKCHDYTVYCHKIQGDELPDFCVDFTKEGVRVACDSKDENYRITHHLVFISPFALGQLAAKLGVPMRYVNKCADAGFFELANRNFTGEKSAGRTHQENARLAFSARYRGRRLWPRRCRAVLWRRA